MKGVISMKKVLHFIFDFLKLYVLMALILALVIFVAKGTQFLGTDNSVQAIIEAITPAELFFAPFGIAFTLAITIADREKQKNDKEYAKKSFMRRCFQFEDDDDNGLG